MPLVFDGDGSAELKAWFLRERPDAIIASGDSEARAVARELGLKIPGRIGFATTNRAGRSIIAGIEERPEEIGAAAVRLLTSLIQHGEKGVPAVPTVTMVKGEWVSGPSVRAAPAARARPATDSSTSEK